MTNVFIPHNECWISSGACLEESRCLQKCKVVGLPPVAVPVVPSAVAVPDARAAFEMAYATEWHKSRSGDESVETLASEIKGWREGDTYGDDLPRLKFGWEGYQWALAAAPAAAPAGWKLVPAQVPDSAFPWVSGGYSTDYRARDPRDQKIIEERAQRTWAAILDGIAAAPAADAPDMVSVKKEDAINYCRILAELGMEEEGDPVAEVKRLIANARE